MMEAMEVLETRMKSVQGNLMAARPNQRVHEVNLLEADIVMKCLGI